MLTPLYDIFGYGHDIPNAVLRYAFYYSLAFYYVIAVGLASYFFFRGIDRLAWEAYYWIRTRGGLRCMTYSTQAYYLIWKASLFLSSIVLRTSLASRSNDFSHYRRGGLFALMRLLRGLVVTPLHIGPLNAVTWIIVLQYTHPEWFTRRNVEAMAKHLAQLLSSFDLGGALAWLSIGLLLLLLGRAVRLKARLAYEEDRYRKAIEVSSQLIRALSKVAFASDKNIDRLAKDLRGYLPRLWRHEVRDAVGSDFDGPTGYRTKISTSDIGMTDRASRLSAYEDLGDAFTALRSALQKLSDEGLWPEVSRLWPSVSPEITQLGLRLDNCVRFLDLKLLDASALRRVLANDVEAVSLRVKAVTTATNGRRPPKEEPRHPSSMRLQVRNLAETTPQEVINEIDRELQEFQHHMKDLLAEAVFYNVCAHRIVQAIGRRNRYSRIAQLASSLSR